VEEKVKWDEIAKTDVDVYENIEKIDEFQTVLCRPGEFFDVIETDEEQKEKHPLEQLEKSLCQ
jgi:hypothetical protein